MGFFMVNASYFERALPLANRLLNAPRSLKTITGKPINIPSAMSAMESVVKRATPHAEEARAKTLNSTGFTPR